MVGRLRRLADRLRIRRIVLLPLHERFYILRRNQLHFMPQLPERARPVLRTAARLHRHHASRLRLEEIQDLRPADLATQHHPARRIRTVHLKNIASRYPFRLC